MLRKVFVVVAFECFVIVNIGRIEICFTLVVTLPTRFVNFSFFYIIFFRLNWFRLLLNRLSGLFLRRLMTEKKNCARMCSEGKRDLIFYLLKLFLFSTGRVSAQGFSVLLPLGNFCSDAYFSLYCLGMFFLLIVFRLFGFRLSFRFSFLVLHTTLHSAHMRL